MKETQEKYLKELEKYKDVVLEVGFYRNTNSGHRFEIVEIREDYIVIANTKGFVQKRTPHWCRKNLAKV